MPKRAVEFSLISYGHRLKQNVCGIDTTVEPSRAVDFMGDWGHALGCSFEALLNRRHLTELEHGGEVSLKWLWVNTVYPKWVALVNGTKD